MTDLKTLALQSDPIQGEITEILSPELRAHVQTLIDAAVMKERARCDRLREALKQASANFKKIGYLCEPYGMHRHEISNAMDAIKQALEAKP